MLEVRSLHAYYGSSHVLFDISLEVGDGEAVALLGRNGAGKSTTLKSIMNLEPRVDGHIDFSGASIAGERAYRISRRGMGYVPEDRRIYPELSVEENLLMGRSGARDGRVPLELSQIWEWFPALADMRARSGGALSGGEQQMLAIARTLMGSPKLLLLDEPTEGLAPLIVSDLLSTLQRLMTEQGIALLLCEQNLAFSLALVDRVYVIDTGHVVYKGSVDDFRTRTDLQQRYLAL